MAVAEQPEAVRLLTVALVQFMKVTICSSPVTLMLSSVESWRVRWSEKLKLMRAGSG